METQRPVTTTERCDVIPPMDAYFNDGFHSDIVVSRKTQDLFIFICLQPKMHEWPNCYKHLLVVHLDWAGSRLMLLDWNAGPLDSLWHTQYTLRHHITTCKMDTTNKKKSPSPQLPCLTASRNGCASHCHRCCASQTTEFSGRPLHRRRLSQYPKDAWASRELVSLASANAIGVTISLFCCVLSRWDGFAARWNNSFWSGICYRIRVGRAGVNAFGAS